MDIMGFKDMISRKSHGDVEKTLQLLQSAIGIIEMEAEQSLRERATKRARGWGLFSSIVRAVFFSDSILLVSSDDSPGSAEDLLYAVEWVLHHAILKGIPMKGAIAYGEQTDDFGKSLHFGRPLVDAYELQNELIMYGVVLHHTAEQQIIDTKMMIVLENEHLFKYRAPMKSGAIMHYLVDWAWFPEEDGKLESALSRLYGSVSGRPRRYVDNTIDFLSWLTRKRYEST